MAKKNNQQVQTKKSKALVLVLLLFMAACQDPNTVYHSFLPIQSSGWEKIDTLNFILPPDIPEGKKQFEIGIRHKDSYPYRDIWLTITCQALTDTLHLYLTDPNGTWKGVGIGGNKQFTHKLTKPYIIHSTDSNYVIQITHIMQDTPLIGINDVGLCIKELP